RPARRAGKQPLHRELVQKRIAELRARIPVGGLREAVVSALIYAGLGWAAVDERGFETVRRIRQAHGDMPLAQFKALVREQFLIVVVDGEGAVSAVPSMLPADPDMRRRGFELIEQVMGARGELSTEDRQRMLRIARAFDINDQVTTVPNLTIVPQDQE